MSAVAPDNTDKVAGRRVQAVIRFKRGLELPKFSVKAGERWGFIVLGSHVQRLRNIKAGEPFNFAGGQVLAQDVEIVYEGTSGLEFSIAAGYITDPDLIALARAKVRS